MIKKLYILFITFFMIPVSFSIDMTNNSELFHKGNQAYEEGNYEEAENLYKKLLNTGIENGSIYYNLGNIFFRRDDIGSSIFYFRKALEFMPRNGDIKFNLAYAREKAHDKIQDNEGYTLEKLSLSIPWGLHRSYQFFVLFSFLFWGFCSFMLFVKKREWFRSVFFGIVLVYSLSIINLFIKEKGKVPFGVVRADRINVYSAVGKDNVVLFTLHKGAEFKMLERYNGNWIQISLGDGKKGWVQQKNIVF